MKTWWNETVGATDSVILLGDRCFKKTEFPRLKELHGIKYLVRGRTKNFNFDSEVSLFNLERG